MKKIFLFALATSMAFFVACGDDSSSSPSGGSGKTQISEESVKAFFPTGYKTEDVVAWYASDVETRNDKGQTKTTVEAVYLFKDGTFIATESQLKVKSDNTKKFSNEVATKGTWTSTDNDFENGSFEITFNVDDEEITWPLTVQNGSMTVAPPGDQAMTFKLQSSSVPTPADAGEIVEEADNGNNSDDVCYVTTSGNSVTMTATYEGRTEVVTATIKGDQIEVDINGSTRLEPRDGTTLSELKSSAEKSCEELKDIVANGYNYDDDYYY